MVDKPRRQLILEKGIELTTGDRNNTYGDPHHNLTTFAHLVNAYLKGLGWTGPKLDSVDASAIMVLTKVSRVAVNKNHDDNYVDMATYAAIGGECALKNILEEKEPTVPYTIGGVHEAVPKSAAEALEDAKPIISVHRPC